MSFPSNNVHRRSRRNLGRGQGPFPPAVSTTFTGSGSTAVLTFSSPVNVSGNIPITVATLTFVSQTINSPTQVTITMSGSVATHAYSLASTGNNLSSYQEIGRAHV